MSIEADPVTAQDASGPVSPWIAVCQLQDLVPERGAAALVRGEQVALFRLVDDTVRAVQHQDPFTGAHVLARGIVGTRGTTPTVASPLHKQVFDLRTGGCLDPADGPTLRTWDVRVEEGVVLVSAAPESGGPS
ncbi:nitrite reductase small subunit NirD [Actinotalea sp. BY-33]|uniref:Nitrite reductase small subunit NirD n=1 Tax=Actinotalea soli TaxID=2819234 RepID=A0A939LQB1_9CELL|nr:nitrite reductase small subunit NirD [Actinotalea soli]MBO1750630.1 nitrite reductase small subunit NirD [Actinotalea soli]